MSADDADATSADGHEPAGALELSIVALAVAGGLVLRLWAPSPLWLDEALSVHLAQLPLGDLGEALRHDGHPPLYYGLLNGWIALFGDGDLAVRSLSALAGTALLPLSWALGRDVGGRRAGRLALALAASSPFVLRYSTEARMYALVMALVAAGALLVRRALREPRPARLAALAAVTALLVLTHYWVLWLGAATALVLVVVAWREPDRRPAALRVLGALAAGSLAFVAWLPAFLDQVAHTGTPWGVATRPTVLLATAVADLGGGRLRDAEVLGLLLVLLVALGLLARPLDERSVVLDLRTVPGLRGEGAVIALTLAIGGALGLLTGSTFAGRYAAVVVPLVLVVAAVGLAKVPWPAARSTLALAVVVGGLGIGAVNAAEDRTQAGAIGAAIEDAAAPGDLVVTCPDQLGPSLRRVLPDEVPLVAYPRLDDGRLVDWVDYEERNAANDPASIAREVEALVEDGAAIFVSWGGDYRTLEGQCQALVSALQATRPVRVDLVAADGAVFEHATLTWLRPRTP